jgi:antitoxin CptB
MWTDRSGPSKPEGRRRVGAEELRRLRWRARRGLLENDLLIGRFLDRQAGALDAADADALARLMDLPEPLLLDLLLGRRQPAGELDDPAVRDMLVRVRDGSNP